MTPSCDTCINTMCDCAAHMLLSSMHHLFGRYFTPFGWLVGPRTPNSRSAWSLLCNRACALMPLDSPLTCIPRLDNCGGKREAGRAPPAWTIFCRVSGAHFPWRSH
jgi:hypothetical protein